MSTVINLRMVWCLHVASVVCGAPQCHCFRWCNLVSSGQKPVSDRFLPSHGHLLDPSQTRGPEISRGFNNLAQGPRLTGSVLCAPSLHTLTGLESARDGPRLRSPMSWLCCKGGGSSTARRAQPISMMGLPWYGGTTPLPCGLVVTTG